MTLWLYSLLLWLAQPLLVRKLRSLYPEALMYRCAPLSPDEVAAVATALVAIPAAASVARG